jgi:hypothetical protein
VLLAPQRSLPKLAARHTLEAVAVPGKLEVAVRAPHFLRKADQV